jgi:hypothetical protein
VAVSYQDEWDSSAAIDDAGDVVVSYTRREFDGSLRVYAQRVATGGANLGLPIALTPDGTGHDFASEVDMDHVGNFVVAFGHGYSTYYPYSDIDILARQFGWDGAARSGTLYVTYSTTEENSPSVAVGNGGKFVINYLTGSTSNASLRTLIYYTPPPAPPTYYYNPYPYPIYWN